MERVEHDDFADWSLQARNDALLVEHRGIRPPNERAPRYVPAPTREEEMIRQGWTPLSWAELTDLRNEMRAAMLRADRHDWSNGWEPVEDGFTHYEVVCRCCGTTMRIDFGRDGDGSFLQLYGPLECRP